MAIVSNKPDNAVKDLSSFWFPGIYALGETADCPRKPAADMVYKAMAAIGVEKCIYIGDSEVDILTARNAGVPCLSVTWGFRDLDVLQQAGGDHFCGSVAEFVSTVEEMIHGK
jgi:phosphoglycolate phosphatase